MKRIFVDPGPVLARQDFDSPDHQARCLRAQRLTLPGRLDRLLAVEQLARLPGAIDVFPHQQETALAALTTMHGRAILADEVGLGKTIEAGLIVKELLCRQLARRVLILVPASLASQWQGELLHKFDEQFVVASADGGWDADLLIASLDGAKHERHASELLARSWDLVVVDEAHRLRNAETLGHRFVRELSARQLLLLTATPIQNGLEDLYSLIDLIDEGALGTRAAFRAAFMADPAGRTLKNADRLGEIIRARMIRHRRSEVGLSFPRRQVESIRVRPHAREARLHEQVEAHVKRAWPAIGGGRGQRALALVRLARMAASSPRALAASLEGTGRQLLAEDLGDLDAMIREARGMEGTKAQVLLSALAGLNEKAIVFMAFRETLSLLEERLAAAGIPAVAFHGGLSAAEKRAALSAFRGDARVLLATDAGSEGLNLQFCRVLVNYDLPWNPMRLEQRIGRVHRLGQPRDVLVVNLVLEDTIEARVLAVLEEKIALFTAAVGETEEILSQLSGLDHLEKTILDLVAAGDDLSALGDRLDAARSGAAEVRQLQDALFGAIR